MALKKYSARFLLVDEDCELVVEPFDIAAFSREEAVVLSVYEAENRGAMPPCCTEERADGWFVLDCNGDVAVHVLS
ncbi:MAG: hypothetical protein AB7G93_16425 [Bdellovibrionales bacterium]